MMRTKIRLGDGGRGSARRPTLSHPGIKSAIPHKWGCAPRVPPHNRGGIAVHGARSLRTSAGDTRLRAAQGARPRASLPPVSVRLAPSRRLRNGRQNGQAHRLARKAAATARRLDSIPARAFARGPRRPLPVRTTCLKVSGARAYLQRRRKAL